MPSEIVVEQVDRETFLKIKNSLQLSRAFLKAFRSYVECRKGSLKSNDSNYKHFVLFAREADSPKGIAFHYFYINLSTGWCDLYGLFVEPPYRSHGLGARLLADAIESAIRLGATSIDIKFTEKGASRGKLVSAFLDRIAPYRQNTKFCVIADEKYL